MAIGNKRFLTAPTLRERNQALGRLAPAVSVPAQENAHSTEAQAETWNKTNEIGILTR